MRSLINNSRGRIALLLLAGVLAVSGAVYAVDEIVKEDVIEGRALDPVQGSTFTINNSAIVNSAAAIESNSGGSYASYNSRIGVPLNRVHFNVQRTHADQEWSQYE